MKKKSVTVQILETDYEFLDKYCPMELGIPRATWIAGLVRKEVKRIQQQEQEATAVTR